MSQSHGPSAATSSQAASNLPVPDLDIGVGGAESALSGPRGVRVEVSCRVPTPYCRPRSAAVGQVEGRDLRVLCVVWEVKVGRLLCFPLHCAAILGGS